MGEKEKWSSLSIMKRNGCGVMPTSYPLDTCSSSWKSWPWGCGSESLSPGPHSGAGTDGQGKGEAAPTMCEQESWPSPSQAAAPGRVGPEPLLGSTVELALEHGYRCGGPDGMRAGEPTLHDWSSAGELALVGR